VINNTKETNHAPFPNFLAHPPFSREIFWLNILICLRPASSLPQGFRINLHIEWTRQQAVESCISNRKTTHPTCWDINKTLPFTNQIQLMLEVKETS